MNLRCAFCQTPYAIGRTETLAALQKLEAEHLTHYDAHCPRCRRVTQVLRQKLEQSLPNWKEALSEMTEEAAPHQSAPQPVPAKKAAPKAKTAAASKSASAKKSAQK